MARPKKQINEEQVKSLAGINCSYEEMAAVLQCDERTLQRRFAAVIKEGRATGRMSLKRKQWELAMNSNVAMLIWLGKQLLDQKEPRFIELSGGQTPIQHNVQITQESKDRISNLVDAITQNAKTSGAI